MTRPSLLGAFRSALAAFSDPCLTTFVPGALDQPFEVWRWLPIDRVRGIQFVEATGDANPIHTEQDVVPGAFILAACLSSLEVLLPEVRLERVELTFSRVCTYGLDLELELRGRSDPEGGLRVECRVTQCGHEVAAGGLEGRLRQAGEAPRVARDAGIGAPDPQVQARVEAFCDALGIDPAVYLARTGGAYPQAFLCALAPGQLVESLDGQGGLLNRIGFELDDVRLPLGLPTQVALHLPARARPTFNRIGLELKGGGETLATGRALVLPGLLPAAAFRAG